MIQASIKTWLLPQSLYDGLLVCRKELSSESRSGESIFHQQAVSGVGSSGQVAVFTVFTRLYGFCFGRFCFLILDVFGLLVVGLWEEASVDDETDPHGEQRDGREVCGHDGHDGGDVPERLWERSLQHDHGDGDVLHAGLDSDGDGAVLGLSGGKASDAEAKREAEVRLQDGRGDDAGEIAHEAVDVAVSVQAKREQESHENHRQRFDHTA